MAELVSYATPRGPAGLEKNRAAGLVAFGIITLASTAIVLAFGVFAIAMMISGEWTRPGGSTTGLVFPVVALFLMMALVVTAMIWLGIGSIRRRRWVRPLTVPLAWLWLASGMFGTVTFAIGNVIAPVVTTYISWGVPTTSPATGPVTYEYTDTSTPPPAPAGAAVTTTTTWSGVDPLGAIAILAAMTLFIVALPMAYILFYRSRHVRQTLEVYDPRARWTDRRPLPVLGLSVWCAVLAWNELLIVLTPYTDFFGDYVVGPPAVGLALLKAATLATVAVLCYRQNLLGWWLALAYVIFAATSLVATHWIGNVEAIRPMLEAMDSEEDARPIVQRTSAILYALAGILGIAYLLYVRRHFTVIPAAPA